MVTTTALSLFLLEDLHEYHEECFPPGHPGSYPSPFGEALGRVGQNPVGSRLHGGSQAGPSISLLKDTDSGDSLHGSGCRFVDVLSGGVEGSCSTVGLVSDRSDHASERDRMGFRLSDRQARAGDAFDVWYPGAPVTEVACRSLVVSLFKKFKEMTSDDAEARALDKFLSINTSCALWNPKWQFSWEEELVGLVKSELDDFLHPNGEPLIPSDTTPFERGRCGPGASLGADGVDFYTKLFSSDLTATSSKVYELYIASISNDPTWRDAEISRLLSCRGVRYTLESEVTFVPKNRDTMRSICTEPNLNMFAQLGIGEILTDRLKSYFGIDLSRQPSRNAELARLGSLDGSISTIDLESASDSFSIPLAEAILPAWFYDTLMLYRCPYTRVGGDRVLLWMVSTMGNGFTFPLQTLFFACCVRAVARQMSDRPGRADATDSRWGVFGDDIACPSDWARRVCHLLHLFGFRVNSAKSYIDKHGTFRESCGFDYYCGQNVRGVYLKALDTAQSRLTAINLLNDWSARWGVPLRRTVGYLRDSVRVMAIPPWASSDAGVRLPLEALRSGHVAVYRSERWKFSFVFKQYEAYVPSLRVLDDSIANPPNVRHIKRRQYNPSGLLLAVIGGYVKGGKIPISLKQGERPTYRTRLRVTPFWGPTVEQVDLHPPGFWERWNIAVRDNLGL